MVLFLCTQMKVTLAQLYDYSPSPWAVTACLPGSTQSLQRLPMFLSAWPGYHHSSWTWLASLSIADCHRRPGNLSHGTARSPSSCVWLSVCGIWVCRYWVAQNTPSRKIYSPCSAGSTEASLHLNLLPFGFGFRSLPLCHTYFMFESMSAVWLHGQEPLSFLSLLALIFYFITSPHPFLAFSMHAIEWNVPFYILDFWPEMKLCQSWTLAQWINCSVFRAEILHWIQMATNTVYQWAKTVKARIIDSLGKYEQ